MAIDSEFDVGFLVVLKSGGPVMAITAKEGTNLRAVWFNADDCLCHGVFPPEVLEDFVEDEEETDKE